MPKFLVTKSVDAFVNYSAVVEAETADAAQEIAVTADPVLDWQQTSVAEFDHVDFDNIPPELVADDFALEPETDLDAEMVAVLHIAKEAILTAAAKVLGKPDWQPGEYASLMQAKEHIERTLAKAAR